MSETSPPGNSTPTNDASVFSTAAPGQGRPDRIRQAIFLIRKLMQSGAYYTKELNKKHNVSAPQIACLLALQESGPMSLSQIAKNVMVKSSTLTGIVDRLESKGLVARTRTSQDRRVITIELTPAGRNLATNAPPPIQMKIVEGLKQLDEEEREQIIQALSRLADMIDAQELGPAPEQEIR
jgi:DNA-binding MarR family transcriptional regulator